jgi:hypothetical protein
MTMQVDFEQRVRERAYYLWQKEGSQEGREQEFWQRALLLEQAETEPPMQTPLLSRSPEEKEMDKTLADTFPASDPPSFSDPARVGDQA